jgi:hypothetical protein
LDGNDLRDFRNVVSKISLDALLQSHVAAGAPVTGAVKSDLHNALARYINQFDISAIGLHGRTNQVDDALNFLAHRLFAGGFGSGCRHRFISSIIDANDNSSKSRLLVGYPL